MRVGGILHPNFFYAPRRTVESAEIVDIQIYRVAPNGDDWDPYKGMQPEPDELVWKGKGRFQPNIDWRARPREVQFEYDATHSVRIQIPVGKNQVGAVWNEAAQRFTSYGEDPKFIKDMRVWVDKAPVKGFEYQEGINLFIRNALSTQNVWQYNLLCDTKTGA